jgi:Domain of unknown function (DUF4136)
MRWDRGYRLHSWWNRLQSGRLTCKSVLALSALVLIAAPLFVTQLSAQKVKIKYQKTTDFTKYKTYAWVPGTPVFDPKLDSYITDTVSHELHRSGMKVAAMNSADLFVTYHAAVNTNLSVGTAIDPTYAASGGVPHSGSSIWETAGAGATHVTKGSLTVEILDRVANRPIWTGTVKHTLSDRQAERWDDIQKALDKLFREFPPTAKK